MSEFEIFWCYFFSTLYIEAVAIAAVFAALAAAARCEELRNALCLMYTTL